jgi:hypothetical protein
MKCMAYWIPTTFGSKLHAECHGCARMRKVGEPLGKDVQVAPQFSDKCPMRVEEGK